MRIIQLIAPNPGLFTGSGTNTWVLEMDGEALIIDPGPQVDSHIRAVLKATDPFDVVGVAATHAHPDHAPAAHPLAAALGVPVMAFQAGPGLRPDRLLVDGGEIGVGSIRVVALHTPGHSPDHLCYCAGAVVFTGDLVIDGDGALVEHVPEYLESLEHLYVCGPRVVFPGHGNPMRDPRAVITAQAEAIRDRESRILAALEAGATTVGDVVERVYPGLDRALYFPTAENVGAHLRKLSGDGRVALPGGAVEWAAQVTLVSAGLEEV